MVLKEAILANFVTLILLFGLAFVILFNRDYDKRNNRLFFAFIIIVFALDISDIGDYCLAAQDVLSPWRYVTSSLGYTLRTASLAMIVTIVMRREKSTMLIWIPVAVVALFVFTTPWTHWVFYFNDANLFIRGPIGYLPHVISLIYVVFGIAMMIVMMKKVGLGEILLVAFIAIISIGSALLEILADANFLITGAMVVSCTVYYIFLYVNVYKRDALTGLLNRHSFYLRGESLAKSPFAVVSIDLNGLKALNDSQGHQEGDLALCTLANACLSAGKKDFVLYRTGGDEFVALGKGASIESAEAFVAQTKRNLAKTPYMASFGCAVSDGHESFDAVLNRSDELMYQDKKNYPHRE
jgi:diguanylate cyclase (GGDEF)-like protein